MKNKITTAIIFLIVLSTIGFAGCRGKQTETSPKQITEVIRGDLVITVPADGNLELPEAMELFFDTTAFTPPYSSIITWESPDIKEGDFVREGTLLAKLDDTYQKKNVASAQYDVELATNELVEKIHPALMGYPENYPDTSTVLRVEQAQDELAQAQKFLEQAEYQEAAAELRLATHDLDASYEMLNVPEITMSLQGYSELGTPVDNYPDISRAINLLKQDRSRLAKIQKFIGQGDYENAKAELKTAQGKLKETHLLVKSFSGRIRVSQRIGACCQQLAGQKSETSTGLMPLPYPDTSTSLDWMRQVEAELQKIQACKDTDSCDALELSTLLRMAQHDVEMSQTILENNELTFLAGLNLKALRTANLNLQKAEQTLEKTKESLIKTELLAPFDGIIEDINLKEDDSIGQRFSATGQPMESYIIRLVNTKDWRMTGVVDEVDIFKVKVGQEAIITVDALPGEELKGMVTFVSPFGSRTTGVVEFPVTISMDPTETELKGGLTATADIIVEKHENVLLVPNRSIKGSPGDYWVEVVLDEKTMTTEKRPVELGAQNEQSSEVISGLSEGEKIIVEATRGRLPTSP
jgi:RND family efflux transporter MFP subunit